MALPRAVCPGACRASASSHGHHGEASGPAHTHGGPGAAGYSVSLFTLCPHLSFHTLTVDGGRGRRKGNPPYSTPVLHKTHLMVVTGHCGCRAQGSRDAAQGLSPFLLTGPPRPDTLTLFAQVKNRSYEQFPQSGAGTRDEA